MNALDVICIGVTIAAVVFAARCYYELWRWARQMQGARIAIAYKGKVKLQAPLQEWMLWCNNLDKDKGSTGRVIFKMGSTTVAIVKKPVTRSRKTNSAPDQSVREGKWKATDETPRVGAATE